MSFDDILQETRKKEVYMKKDGCFVNKKEFSFDLINKLNQYISDSKNKSLNFDENDYVMVVRFFNEIVCRYNYDVSFLERLFKYKNSNKLDIKKIWDNFYISDITVGVDFLFDYITKDEFLKKLYNSDNFSDVYNILDRYSKYIVKKEMGKIDCKKSRDLLDKMFIDYLNFAKDRNKNCMFLEKVLLNGYYVYDREVFNYLLDQDINLHYRIDDASGCLSLIDILAVYCSHDNEMKNSIVMGKIINKSDGRKFFANDFGKSTNLCRMYIIAGDLDGAFREFYTGKYYSYSNRDLVKLLYSKDCFFIDESNGEDEISNIIRELYLSDVEDYKKEEFLLKVLYDDRTVLIEEDSIDVIKRILNEDNYNKYINYLSDKINNKRAAVFKIVKVNRKRWDYLSYGLVYVELDSILEEKNNVRKLKKII